MKNNYVKNIKKSYKVNKLKITASTWNKEFELPGGSYSASGTQYYLKKTWQKDW